MAAADTTVRPTRVLMVTGAYHPEISSSALQCREMARQLAGRVDIRVLTTAVDPSLPLEDVVDGVPVSRVLVDVSSRRSKLQAALRMAAVLPRLLARCDLVHLHGVSTKNVLVTAAARLYGRPVVVSLHTAGFDEAATVRRQGTLAWWAFRRADRFLGVSPGLVEAYLDAGLPADRIQLVPNGIDTSRFSPATPAERRALRDRLGLPLDSPIVLFVGFFSHDKQPRVLFDAWLALRETMAVDSVLLFVGATRSSYFEVDDEIARTMHAEAEARKAGDRLIFAGPTADVHHYFRAADLFVLPSRREGLPVALLEAMACALPCVASRLPGSTDAIIEDGHNGRLVPPGDVPALADALVCLLRDAELAAALGQAARQTVIRRYSHADVANEWLNVYRQLHDRRPR